MYVNEDDVVDNYEDFTMEAENWGVQNNSGFRMYAALVGADFLLREFFEWYQLIIEETDTDSDGDYSMPAFTNSADKRYITELGSWSDSPQGHEFWMVLHDFVHDGNPYNRDVDDLLFILKDKRDY